MKMLKNKSFILLFLFALACMPVSAQHHRGQHRPPMERGRGEGFDPQKVRQEAERFITIQAGLTPQEANRFFPLFHELKRQHRDIRGKMRRAMERAESASLTNRDASRIMAEIKRLKRQEVELDDQAYTRFERILPPHKLLKVMHADQELRKKMFRRKR